MEDLKQRVEDVLAILEKSQHSGIDFKDMAIRCGAHSELREMPIELAEIIKELTDREAKILAAWKKFKPWAISTLEGKDFICLRESLEELEGKTNG